jgi:hypothetical protein
LQGPFRDRPYMDPTELSRLQSLGLARSQALMYMHMRTLRTAGTVPFKRLTHSASISQFHAN